MDKLSLDSISRCDISRNSPLELGELSSAPSTASKSKSQNRVVIFRKDLLPISETFILDQFKSYQSWQPTLLGYKRVDGLQITSEECLTLQRKNNRFDSISSKFFQHGQYWGIISHRLLDIVRGIDPKIIHAHFGYDALLIYDIAKALRIPLVVTLHGADAGAKNYWSSGKAGFFFRRYPAKMATMVDDENVHFIAVSEAVRATAIQNYPRMTRIHTLYTGIDCSQFPVTQVSAENRKKVLFIGRLVEVKGCKFLLQAMEIVQKSSPDSELVVIGDGPLRSELETMARQLSIRVKFVGQAPRSTVKEYLGISRLLVLPSITNENGQYEAFGMVVLEAQSSGVPVVTSARGGLEGIIDGHTGFAFSERDYAALADRILKVSTDNHLFNSMSLSAIQHVRANFDIEKCTAKIEDLYDTITLK